MAIQKITLRAVGAATSTKGDGFLWDDDLKGFGLKVTVKGAKSYIYQYRMGGRGTPTRRYTIGGHGSPWTPATAREEAERLAVMVARGIDPIDNKREIERAIVDLAFKAYVETFITKYLAKRWKNGDDEAAKLLRRHAVPVLKSKPLPSITSADLADVIDKIPEEQLATRRNVYVLLRKLFRWAKKDLAGADPLSDFEPPPAPPSRDRTLSDEELKLAWVCAGQMGDPFGPWIQLLAVLGQRRSETASLDWSELNRTGREWRIPAEKSKNGIAHVVSLNALAVQVLDAIVARTTRSNSGVIEKWPRRGLLFSTNGEAPISGYSKAKKRLDTLIAKADAERAKEEGDEPMIIPPWRFHDLRRTLATGMQRLGVRFEVTEAILNHVGTSKTGVAAVYQRHDWATEKRDALEAWSRHIKRLVDGSDKTNVIHIAAVRA